MHARTRLAVLLLLLFVSDTIAAPKQDSTAMAKSQELLKNGVEVSARPEKLTFHLGEPIVVTFKLQNVGTQPFYIQRQFGPGLDGNGVFFVSALPLRNCSLQAGRGQIVDYVVEDP